MALTEENQESTPVTLLVGEEGPTSIFASHINGLHRELQFHVAIINCQSIFYLCIIFYKN